MANENLRALVTPEILAKRKSLKKKQMRVLPGHVLMWFYGHLVDLGPPGVWTEPKILLHVSAARKERAREMSLGHLQAVVARFSLSRFGSKVIRYSDLRLAAASDGECWKCGYYPNSPVSRATADAGIQEIVVCSGCGMVMKRRTRVY